MNNNEFSELSTCGNGVRQVPILLPFLFSLYLNDLETFLEKNNVTDLRTLSDELEQELGLIMLKKMRLCMLMILPFWQNLQVIYRIR